MGTIYYCNSMANNINGCVSLRILVSFGCLSSVTIRFVNFFQGISCLSNFGCSNKSSSRWDGLAILHGYLASLEMEVCFLPPEFLSVNIPDDGAIAITLVVGVIDKGVVKIKLSF